MQFLKTVTDLAKHTRRKSHIEPSINSQDIQALESSRKTGSLAELGVLNSIQEAQSVMTITDKQPLDDTNQLVTEGEQRVPNLQPRVPVKLEYISKVTCQESDSELSPEIGTPMLEENPLKAVKGIQKSHLQKEQNKAKKGKENRKSPKALKKGKGQNDHRRQSFSASNMQMLKEKLASKWGKKEGKSVTDAPQIGTRKSLADVDLEANEMDEQHQEQIKQISRSNMNAKSHIDLRESNCLVAQEDNPLSKGTLKIALQHSMRPAKANTSTFSKATTLEKTTSHNQEHQANTIGSFSKLEPIEGTKTTLDRSPKTGSGSRSVLSLTSFTNQAAIKNKSVLMVRPTLKTLFNIFIEYGIVAPIFAFVFYCILPLGILFAAHDYEEKTIRIVLNFGFLGLLRSLVEIALIQYFVDFPISKKVKEIEGDNAELISLKKYQVLSGYKVPFVLIYTIGLQIGSGAVILGLNYDVDALSVLVSSIAITFISAFFWYVVTIIQAPPKIENKKKLLTKQLHQISKLRQDFLDDLRITKKGLDQRSKTLQEINEEAEPQRDQATLHLAYAGIASGVQVSLRTDVKKFRCGDISKYSEELLKIRSNVLKIYAMLTALLIQLLVLTSVLKGVNQTESVGAALGFFVLNEIISALFGIINCSAFKKGSVPVTKIFNLIIAGGTYRFFYLVAPDQGTMIGAVILNFLIKIITYYVPLTQQEKIERVMKENSILKVFTKKNKNAAHFYNSEKGKEENRTEFIRSRYQKMIVLQDISLYFGFGSLVLIAASNNWFPDLNFNLNLKSDDFSFYIGLVIIEAAIDILILIHFSVQAQKAIKKQVKAQARLIDEVKEVFRGRKLVVVLFKALVLFFLLFIV